MLIHIKRIQLDYCGIKLNWYEIAERIPSRYKWTFLRVIRVFSDPSPERFALALWLDGLTSDLDSARKIATALWNEVTKQAS